MKRKDFFLKNQIQKKKSIFYISFITFLIGTSFINLEVGYHNFVDRTVVFHTQSLDTNTIKRHFRADTLSYYLLQNLVKSGGSVVSSREVYDLAAYVYDREDSLLEKRKTRLDRVKSGPHEYKLKSDKDVNVSIYRIRISDLNVILKEHSTATALIFKPLFTSDETHVGYLIYPNDILAPEIDTINLDIKNHSPFFEKSGFRFILYRDYTFLNPSPPRNTLEE